MAVQRSRRRLGRRAVDLHRDAVKRRLLFGQLLLDRIARAGQQILDGHALSALQQHGERAVLQRRDARPDRRPGYVGDPIRVAAVERAAVRLCEAQRKRKRRVGFAAVDKPFFNGQIICVAVFLDDDGVFGQREDFLQRRVNFNKPAGGAELFKRFLRLLGGEITVFGRRVGVPDGDFIRVLDRVDERRAVIVRRIPVRVDDEAVIGKGVGVLQGLHASLLHVAVLAHIGRANNGAAERIVLHTQANGAGVVLVQNGRPRP